MTGAAHRLEALRPRGDVVEIDQPLVDRQVQEAVGERQVGAGRELQVQVGAARGLRAPRIDDDQLAAALCCSSIHCMSGGMVSAQFAPHSRSALVRAMSSTGNGRPRSMPKALFCPAAADAMQ